MPVEDFCKYLLDNYHGYTVKLRCGKFGSHNANPSLIDNSCVWADNVLCF